MTHREKLAYMMNDLSRRGLKKNSFAPPLYRLLWRLGIPATPPHFAHPFANASFMATWFATFFGLFMWLCFWGPAGDSTKHALVVSIAAGIVFGVALATYYASQARKYSLPKWKDYPPGGAPTL